MGRFCVMTVAGAVALALLVGLTHTPAAGQTPKSGGTLNVTQREDLPQGFAIHETATISTVWPAMPCFNNLVLFDPLKGTRASTRSSASWPRSGPGRTTSETSSFSCGET